MPEDSTADISGGAATSVDDKIIASQDAPAASSNAGVDNAANSGETDDGSPKSTAEAIASVMGEGTNESDEESPASKEDQEKNDTEKAAAEAARLDKNPRFQEVIAQRDQARNELKEFEPVREFLKKSTLTENDRLVTLQLGDSVNRALIGEVDATEVLNAMVPIIRELQAKAGILLPADIQQAIADGQISEKYAQDLAKQRVATENAANRLERDAQARKKQELDQYNQHVNTVRQEVGNAVTEWETKQQAVDPDYGQKRELIYNHIIATMNERKNKGILTTAKDALEISNTAYNKVTDILIKALPKRGMMQKNIQGGAPSSKVVKQPTNRAEAIRFAIENTGK